MPFIQLALGQGCKWIHLLKRTDALGIFLHVHFQQESHFTSKNLAKHG